MPKIEATLKRKRLRSLAGPRKRRPRAQDEQPSCIVPGCGRPPYARGLCQTHHRQKTTTGKLREIRPYRKRTPGTLKLAGLRLTPQCADAVRAQAAQTGLSLGATIAQLLETWHASTRKERACDGGA